MSDMMMTFPETWEEYEKQYGFADDEKVYTNGSRLIPSFRVKQWLDHLLSAEAEIIQCKDCAHYDDRPCGLVSWYNGKDDFCSRPERRKS